MKRTFNAKGFVELLPEEGKVLYNGAIISERVFIPLTTEHTDWEEINLEELYLSEDGIYLKVNDGASTPFVYNNLEIDDDTPIDDDTEETTTETVEEVVEDDIIELPDEDEIIDLNQEGILYNFRA